MPGPLPTPGREAMEELARIIAGTVPVRATPPPPTPTRNTGSSSTRNTGRSTGGGGGSRSSGGGGSGGGGGGGSSAPKKSNDAPQIAALQRMVDTEFANARDTKLLNIKKLLREQDTIMMQVFDKRLEALLGSSKDNRRALEDSNFANLANRTRERVDLIAEAASLGAGETDTLRSQMVALRNWSANQSDILRSFFDTDRSVSSAITDLNADTRTARVNLAAEGLNDEAQVWANYYDQLADAYTQMGNIQGNPYSDSYKAGSDAFTRAAQAAGSAWQNPGVPSSIKNWTGAAIETPRVNSTQPAAAVVDLGMKRPEGATLRRW